MLWSPAVEMKTLPTLGGFIGGLLHINGNIVKPTADLDENPLYAPNAAKQVGKMIAHLKNNYGDGDMKNVYARLTAPTFMAYAENDPAVDVGEMTRAAHLIKGLNLHDVMYFPKDTYVWHGNITKSTNDAYKAKKWDYNIKWPEMEAVVVGFLKKNF